MVAFVKFVVGVLRRIAFLVLFIPFVICVSLVAYLLYGGDCADRCLTWYIEKLGE